MPSGSRFSDGPAGLRPDAAASTSSRSRHTCGAQHRQHIGAGRGAEAGRELLGDAGAADERTSLQHQRLEAGLGQVEGGDQAVVAAADDDGVLRRPVIPTAPRAASAGRPQWRADRHDHRSEMLVPVGPVITRSPEPLERRRRSRDASSASSRSMPSVASARERRAVDAAAGRRRCRRPIRHCRRTPPRPRGSPCTPRANAERDLLVGTALCRPGRAPSGVPRPSPRHPPR